MDWTVKSSVEGSGGGGGGGGAMVEVVNKRRRMERNILWNSSRLSSREVSALYPGDENSTESDFLVISENLRFFSIYLLIFNFGP